MLLVVAHFSFLIVNSLVVFLLIFLTGLSVIAISAQEQHLGSQLKNIQRVRFIILLIDILHTIKNYTWLMCSCILLEQ